MIGCGIRAEGAKRIGQMLEMNGTLIHLNLEGEIPLNIHSFLCSMSDNHRRGRSDLGCDIDMIICLCDLTQGIV